LPRLRGLPGVTGAETAVNRLTLDVASDHSDEVARLLLNGLGASNLEITTGSLENAFVALTSTTPATRPATSKEFVR
jgi:ABC-2 type transport system ATP-binding protein